MTNKEGKWWDGGCIEYWDNNCVVRIRSGMWWIGVAMLTSLTIIIVFNPAERQAFLSMQNPWRTIIQLIGMSILYALAFFLLQWSNFYADKSKGTYRFSYKWAGITLKKQTGKLNEIDNVIIRENITNSGNEDSRFLHLYIKVQDYELYLFQLCSRLNLMEARKLALFLGCPLMFDNKGFLQKGDYERVESLKEIQSHLATSQSPNKSLKTDQKR